MVSLALPSFRVTLPDTDAFEVQTSNADLVRWDMTSAKHKWPTYKDAPFLWTTFLAWTAARRQKLTDLSWEEWSDRVVQVESIGDDDAAVPTVPEPVSGS
jgi:hypothetical protein